MVRKYRLAALLVAILAVALGGALTWARQTAVPLPEGTRADRVVVRKSARKLDLYGGTELLRTYPVSLGRDPTGPKQREGDGRTPEGS